MDTNLNENISKSHNLLLCYARLRIVLVKPIKFHQYPFNGFRVNENENIEKSHNSVKNHQTGTGYDMHN